MERQQNNHEVLSLAKECIREVLERELQQETIFGIIRNIAKESGLVVTQINEAGESQQLTEQQVNQAYIQYGASEPSEPTVESFLQFLVEANTALDITFEPYYELVRELSSSYVATVGQTACSQPEVSSKVSSKEAKEHRKPKPAHPKVQSSKDSQGTNMLKGSSHPNHLPENNDSRRLKDLFEFYTRKVYRGNSTTFDDIANDLCKMDLTTWMVFNKDSNTTCLVGKEFVHSVFKKYSTMHTLDFKAFQEAIKEVLQKIHPDNLDNGWKMLGVNSNQAVSKRLSKLGIPSYLYQSSRFDCVGTNEVPLSCQFKAPTIDIADITVSPPLKTVNTPKKNQLTLSKLAKLKAQPHFEIPSAEPDDDIYLKSYMLPRPAPDENSHFIKKHQGSANGKSRHAKKRSEVGNFGQSSGIMSRIDERINSMARKL